MHAVIMAGGKGTRLLKITRDEIPKPMATVMGKPILQWQLECLKANGIFNVIIVVGHLGEKITEYFGDGNQIGMSIEYLNEIEPLGTAGSFYYLKDRLPDGPFFLAFGDIIFDINISKMMLWHAEKHAKATLFVHPNSHPFDSDIVIMDEASRVLRFDSKNNVRDYWYDNCVNAGLYVIDKSVCEIVTAPIKTDIEKDILTVLSSGTGCVFGYKSPEYVKDVGTEERIQKAGEEIKSGYVVARNLLNKQKAIFIDRDGTINKKNGLIFEQEQFELEECAIKAIKSINESGYLAIVITNQPVVARGLCSIEDVKGIHRKMMTLLGQAGAFVDDIMFCPHHPDKGYEGENLQYKIDCNCRKPNIGLIENCVEKYNIEIGESWFIGDSTIDIQAGKNAGTKTALVLTGDGGKDGKYVVSPDLVCKNIFEAVTKILEGKDGL